MKGIVYRGCTFTESDPFMDKRNSVLRRIQCITVFSKNQYVFQNISPTGKKSTPQSNGVQ